MQQADTFRALLTSLFQVRAELRDATSEREASDPYLGQMRLSVYAHPEFDRQELLDAVPMANMHQGIVRFSTVGRLREEGWEVARKQLDPKPHHHDVYFPPVCDLRALLIRINMCFGALTDRWDASQTRAI
jgi:hypothetical protein